jgi:hypothetical protein
VAMLEPGVNARDTADCDTPASAATSNEVVRELTRLEAINSCA